MAYYFFPPTKGAADSITALFDFVWPTAAALWNLRWQVRGFVAEAPEATVKQLNDRFIFGSGIHGANLKRACIEHSWNDQTSAFAGVVLINAFAIYEQWADEILVELNENAGSGKKLQFDDRQGQPGLPYTVLALCMPESQPLTTAYYPIFKQNPKYAWDRIVNLLKCYRYFKEARNCFAHSGGIASRKAEEAYQDFSACFDKKSLGTNGDIYHSPISAGDNIKLHLRGVVGFCDVLLRIMTTVDAELCRSKRAEPAFAKMLAAVAQTNSTLSADVSTRNSQVIQRCRKAGLPRPADPAAVYRFLIEKRIVVL